jgi:hypothetical protein
MDFNLFAIGNATLEDRIGAAGLSFFYRAALPSKIQMH